MHKSGFSYGDNYKTDNLVHKMGTCFFIFILELLANLKEEIGCRKSHIEFPHRSSD